MSPRANFIAGALRTFLKHLKKKMPEMVEGEWFLHCVTMPWCTL